MSSASERVTLDRSAEMPVDIARAELLELYKIVVDEYRFQVRLNWDRTQYSFVLNTALTTLGFTVLATLKPAGPLIAIALFVMAAFASHIGRQIVRVGHDYYRRIIHRKTVVEDLLGRHTPLTAYGPDVALHLSTTAGMGEVKKILEATDEYLAPPPRFNSITGQMIAIFWAFLAADALGLGFALRQVLS